VIKQRPENEKFRKYNATLKVYFDIPNKHVVSFFEKCGLIGGASLDDIRDRTSQMKSTVSRKPKTTYLSKTSKVG
jgi:hypothetical protein